MDEVPNLKNEGAKKMKESNRQKKIKANKLKGGPINIGRGSNKLLKGVPIDIGRGSNRLLNNAPIYVNLRYFGIGTPSNNLLKQPPISYWRGFQ